MDKYTQSTSSTSQVSSKLPRLADIFFFGASVTYARNFYYFAGFRIVKGAKDIIKLFVMGIVQRVTVLRFARDDWRARWKGWLYFKVQMLKIILIDEFFSELNHKR